MNITKKQKANFIAKKFVQQISHTELILKLDDLAFHSICLCFRVPFAYQDEKRSTSRSLELDQFFFC